MSDLDATVAWAKTSGGRHRKTGHHRVLLGRPDRLALCGPQPTTQGRSRLVRPACRSARRIASHASGRRGRRAQAPVLGLYGAADTGIPQESVETMRRPSKRPARRARSSFIPTRRTPSSPTTGRKATGRSRPPMAGNGCWSGFAKRRGLAAEAPFFGAGPITDERRFFTPGRFSLCAAALRSAHTTLGGRHSAGQDASQGRNHRIRFRRKQDLSWHDTPLLGLYSQAIRPGQTGVSLRQSGRHSVQSSRRCSIS